MAYATAAELRTQIDMTGSTGHKSDDALEVILDAVSDLIDRFFNRPDGFIADTNASARYYAGSGKRYQYIDECVEITEVAVKDSTSDTTYTVWTDPTTNLAGDGDYIAFNGDPLAPDFNNLPYMAIMTDPNGDFSIFINSRFTSRGGFRPTSGTSTGVPTVKVTAKWGYSVAAPAVVKQATLALSARWFKQGEGAWADTLASPEFGQLIYRRENVDIRQMLELSRLWRPALGRKY